MCTINNQQLIALKQVDWEISDIDKQIELLQKNKKKLNKRKISYRMRLTWRLKN